ncbi:HutD family protein, partial [Escherichia coli]|nr:HutD family protein [Escherichia coli]
ALMAVQKFAVDAIAPTPWKNGGGATREIAVWPPGAAMESFAWRISVADIADDGPFSAFPGVDRQIALLEGAGVHLQAHDDSFSHRLVRVGEP